jgi:hypothetical protein
MYLQIRLHYALRAAGVDVVLYPSTARLLWVESHRSPLLLSVIKLSAFIDAFRSCLLSLDCLASLEGGAHWGPAMRAANAALGIAKERCGNDPATETRALQLKSRRRGVGPPRQGGSFDCRSLQVIRLHHVSKSLARRYHSSLLWEDSHESLVARE